MSALRWAAPRLAAYLDYDFANRDLNNNSLLEWSSPFESGLDQSPVFDNGVEADSPDFSTLAALECHYLSLILAEVGDTAGAARFAAQHAHVTAQVHALLWDDGAQFYNYRNFSGHFRPVRIPTGFFPLLLPNMTAERVQALVGHLPNASEFAARLPIPTVATIDPTYSTK